MPVNSISRKTITDLRNPQQIRELNRQLEWVWHQLLGGLSSKSLSDDCVHTIVNKAESTIARDLSANSVTTIELAAALAKIMVAQIGVAKIDYAQINDIFANQLITEDATAGKVRINNLVVDSAQIVDLIVNSFRLVSENGDVYQVSVDSDGQLSATYLCSESDWLEDGEVPAGYSAVASSLNVDDVTTGTLYVTGAAEIMKLTAKTLIADSAWVGQLTTTLIDSGMGNRLTISAPGGITMSVPEAVETAQNAADSAQSTADAAATYAMQTNAYMAEVRSVVNVETDGVHIRDVENQSNQIHLNQLGMAVHVGGQCYSLFASNYVQFGSYQIRRPVRGGLVFKVKREADI